MTTKDSKESASLSSALGGVLYLPLIDRVKRPTPEEIREARIRSGLTQKQAALLVSTANSKTAYRVWQAWETPGNMENHRPMPLLAWETFLRLTSRDV